MSVHVTTEYGVVGGGVEDGLAFFRDVPYASPPFGALRFRPPVAPESWDGVRDATSPGPGAPQPTFPSDDIDSVYYMPAAQGEDCLTLEVWTPDPGASGLPVMVHIHGGGLMIGSGSAEGYSGRTFARDGVVHVGINYRLGIEGFIYLGEGTDNLGFRDQIFALEWVQRNIAAFGGDPGNVTIYGQSGGAISVITLLAMPAAKGLFVRAIASSGSSLVSCDIEEAVATTKRLARRLGVPPTVEGLSSVPLEKTVPETLALALDFVNPLRHGSTAFTVSPYRAVYGTPSLPEPPLAAALAEPGVPLMTGTARNETTGFLAALGRLDRINPVIGLVFRRLMGVNRAVRRTYRDGPRRITDPLAIIEAAWTDWGLRIPTIRLVEARRAPTWLYEFRWENPSLPAGLGAAHATDNPFVRDDLDAVVAFGHRGELMVGATPPAELATRMHATWVRFATTGDPGWPVYDLETRQTMVFDTVSELVPDAAAPEREAWSKRR